MDCPTMILKDKAMLTEPLDIHHNPWTGAANYLCQFSYGDAGVESNPLQDVAPAGAQEAAGNSMDLPSLEFRVAQGKRFWFFPRAG